MRILRLVPILASLTLAGCPGPAPTDCPVPCGAGEACVGGACVPVANDLAMAVPDMAMGCSPACAAPTPICDGNRCVACAKDADCPAGNVCKMFNGTPTCSPGCADDARCKGLGASFKCCGSQCLDTAKDPRNCGACGKACGVQNSTALCDNGACIPGKCLSGWGDCNNDPADGCETNLHIDPNNCTACGMKCAIKNAVNACSDGCYLASCQYGFDDCNGDAKDGCETSVASDPKNCGACGAACANVAHAKVACQFAQCFVTSCDLGWADCNNDGKDGCETNSGTDAKNCGACGNACGQGLVCVNGGCTCQQCNIPNAMTKCVNNACVFDKCLAGFADCNNNVADGCEVNLGNDAKNCGACGMACPMGMPACLNGACTNAVCHAIGYANCPTGAKQWCDTRPISPTDEAQAKLACETCMGKTCYRETADCAGVGYGPQPAGQYKCNDPYWGSAAGCSGAAGRVWAICGSYTTYGMWAN